MGILQSIGIDPQNLLPLIGGSVKHLIMRTEMDQDDYILMRVFLRQFSQEGSLPFEKNTEMVLKIVIRIGSEQFLSVEHYQRIFENRSGFGKGYKPSRLATPVTMNYLSALTTANHGITAF